MALFKRGGVWWYKFYFAGQLVCPACFVPVDLRRNWNKELVIVQPTLSFIGIDPVSSCIGHGARGVKLARAGTA